MAKNLTPIPHIPSGVNNTVDQVGLPPASMVEAVNVDIWNQEAVLRPGRSVVIPGAAHSFWSDNSVAFFVQNGWVKQFDGSSGTNLKMLSSETNPVAFERVNALIVFSDGVIVGYIEGGAASDFPEPEDRFKIVTQPGKYLAFHNGRLYVAGSELMFTDAYNIAQMDRRNYRIPMGEGGFTMLAAVKGGLWLSTMEAIYFLPGGEPGEFASDEKARYPVVDGAFSVIDAEDFIDGASGKAVVMATREGFCVGFEDGTFKNLSKRKVHFATGKRGTIALRRKNGMAHLVAAMQDTEPASNAFTGESVTVTETIVS